MDKSSLTKDSTVTDAYDSDHFSEIDSNEQVGNVDTLVDDANLENKYDQVFTFAPGEDQHPLSLYHDVDAEYLCFPTIFCGQKCPSKEERTVPVHYSDIVKWELRSVDRRAAQSVLNIFFKHKSCRSVRVAERLALPTSVPGSRVRIPLEARFFPNLNGASLHRAFHVHPSIISK